MSKHHASHWCSDSKRFGCYNRDEWTCAYCEKKFDRGFLSLDHIIPACTFAKGDPNKNHPRNLVTCCTACNNAKGSMSIHDFVKDPIKVARIIMRAANIRIDWKRARKSVIEWKNAA